MKGKEKYPKGKNQGRMKQGYYQIHVLLEQSSSLCLNKNEDVDAMITVQAFGQIQYSKVLKKVGYESKLWGEHFYFSKTFTLDQIDALQRSVIIIKAWDHRKILKDALIGEHELSISRIYEKQRHLIKHTWLALSNIIKNFGEVSGMVKLSVNIIGENDKAQTLQPQPYNASNKDKNILLASGIHRQGHQLTVDIYQGSSLKPVAGQTTDAYIGVQFGMIYSRTETVVNSCQPIWNELVQIPVHYSDKIASVQHIVLRLIDANVFKSKEVLGSCYIPVNQLIQQKKERSFINFYNKKIKIGQHYDQKMWVNFYGPQVDCQNNQFKHKYSIYPQIAPYYTGSVYLKVVLQENSNPRKEHRPRQQTEKSEKNRDEKAIQPLKPKKFYSATVRFQMGMNLPPKFSSYQMSVRIGNFEVKSKMKKVKQGFVLWNGQREFDLAFYENQQFPDVFFYLINEDEDRVCFCREKIILKQDDRNIFYDQGNQTGNGKKKKHYKGEIADKWRKLKPDLTKIHIYNEEAGYVKLKLEVKSIADNKQKNNKKSKAQNQPSFSESTDYYSEKVMSIPCKIVVDFYCAQNLLAGDDDGSADPYFKFIFQDSVKVSSIKESTVNPVYIQRMILDGFMGKQNLIMPLTVTVFNKNPLSDQAIGTCYINLQEEFIEKRIQLNTNYNNIPQWYDIYIDGNKYGKFLAGITIINKKMKLLETIEFFEEQLETYNINLVALGLRSLKSSNSIISIRKPIINFDIESLRCYQRKERKQKNAIQIEKVEKAEKVQKSERDEKKLEAKKQSNQKQSNNLIIMAPTGGSSVNLDRLQTIDIKLPKNKAFWPKLCARVTNSVLGNIYEPHIGYFYIDLKKAFQHTQKLRDQFNSNKKKQQKDQQFIIKSQKLQKLQTLIDKTVLENLKLFVVKSIKYNWREVSKDISEKLNKRLGSKEITQLDQNYIVIMPSYSREEHNKEILFRENHKDIIQSNKEYIKVGYDNKNTLENKTKDQRNRHYRYCLNTTYEAYFKEIRNTNLGIFQQVPIKQGRVFLPQQKSLLTTFTPEERQVGFFKGNCIVVEKESLKEQSQFVQKHRNLFRDYIKEEKFRMFLYILNASSLPSRQAGEPPQPFLIVKIAENQQITFPQKELQRSSNPELNVLIKKDLVFPQNSEIAIQVWDKGMLNSQELIGETVLFAENRVYIQFGKMKFNNPAQTHPLKVMQSRQQQGKIRFWVDFVPLDSMNLYREFDISSAASPQYEVRVIVWNCSDIIQDEQDFTGMFDLYIACCFNNQVKETDVHYRTQNGDASFNWRMLYPVKLPITDTTLVFKIYDKSLVKGDEFKASGQLDIRKYLQEAYENEVGVKLFLGQTDMYSEARLPCEKKADSSGTVIKYSIFPIRMKNRKSEQSHVEVEGGKVYISVQILPKAMAQKKQAGEGRGNPNEHPNLPQPTGRFQFSLNPMTMFTRLFGKKFRSKVCTLIFCFIFMTGFTYFIPSLAGSLLAASI